MENYHCKSVKDTLKELDVSKKGLTEKQVEERKSTSYQETNYIKKNNIVLKFLSQFCDLMIIILLLASAVSIIIGIVQGTKSEIADGCIILAIVLMNAVFGVVQEYKAEKSLEALGKLTQPETFVLREGNLKKINTKDMETAFKDTALR